MCGIMAQWLGVWRYIHGGFESRLGILLGIFTFTHSLGALPF